MEQAPPLQVARTSGGGALLSAAAPSDAHMPRSGPDDDAGRVCLKDLYVQLGELSGLSSHHTELGPHPILRPEEECAYERT